jgi:hypothetical protein
LIASGFDIIGVLREVARNFFDLLQFFSNTLANGALVLEADKSRLFHEKRISRQSNVAL